MVAITAKAANATAPSLAHQGTLPLERLNARSHAYIAPPSISPLWSFTRYLTDANTSQYLVAMPNTPVSHKRAKLTYVAFGVFVFSEGHFDGCRQLALDEPCTNGQEDMRA